MAVYTHLTDSEISEILSAYNIGGFESAQPITEGIDNSNYLLKTSQGKYILTLYESRLVEEEIPTYLHFMAYLQAKGIACPSVQTRNDGRILSYAKGRPVAITEFLAGKSLLVGEPTHVQQVGHLLAHMHQASEGFSERLVNRLAPHKLMPLYLQVKDKLDSLEKGLSEKIQKEIERFQTWPELSLPRAMVHADLFPDNVFFEQGKISGVIDFYFSCEEYLAYDLATTLNAWCFDGEDKTDFNEDKVAALIQGYHHIRPLSEKECEVLPLLLQAMSVRCMLTRARDWFFQTEGAVVKPHNPVEYLAKWQFHQTPKDYKHYIL